MVKDMQIKKLFKILTYQELKVFYFLYEYRKDKTQWTAEKFSEWLEVPLYSTGYNTFRTGIRGLLDKGIIELVDNEKREYRFRLEFFQ